MGVVVSTLKTIRTAVKVLLDLNKQIDDLFKRASAAPGLPNPHPTRSYWLEDPPFPELVNIKSPILPTEADVVVVGSGITGAAIARSILHESRRKGQSTRVIVLESRSICSGATGRNGGHIKSSPHELFARLEKNMPARRAAAVTRFQLSHVKYLTELCQAESIDIAECRQVETTDLYIDEEARNKAFDEVKKLAEWIPELEVETWDSTGAQKKFGVNDYVVGAISYPAGALWPYRFVCSIWSDLLHEFEKTLSIETGTTLQSVKSDADTGFPYELTTNRGLIKCRHVVHATNAFASQFVSGLRGKMTGILSHMSAQRPGKRFPNLDGGRSWSVVYGSGFDYVTQRPGKESKPGDLMLGGGFFRSNNQGMDQVGIWDDSRIDALPVAHLNGIFPTIFEPNWGDDADGGRMKQTWTGIVGVTGDLMPFVGKLDPQLTSRKVPDRDAGEWVAAGFNGDGMVWAWLCGTALGLMIMGSEDEDLSEVPGRPGGKVKDWFPPELLASSERVKKADLANLADVLFS